MKTGVMPAANSSLPSHKQYNLFLKCIQINLKMGILNCNNISK